jgi:hypothetical protein
MIDTDSDDIYDLGDADSLQLPGNAVAKQLPELPRPPVKTAAVPRRRDLNAAPVTYADPDWTAVPSLVVPGAAHLLRGDAAKALCLLTLTAFTLTLAWAIHGTLGRLSPTLEFLGMPSASAVWSLGFLGIVLGCLHIVGIYGGAQPGAAASESRRVHPAVAGVASGILPGLGQLLNRDRGRAILLLSGLWLVAASWLLVTPWMTDLLATQKLVLPTWLVMAASPLVRWTLPAVLWTLGIYDAVTRAGSRSSTYG